MLREQADSSQEHTRDQKFEQRFDHLGSLEPAGVTAHHGVKNQKISDRNETRRKRETTMAEAQVQSEKPVEAEIYGNRKQADQHRQVPLVERVKGGRENFDRGVA